MSIRIQMLKQKKAAAVDRVRAISAAADAQSREMTAEESAERATLMTSIANYNAEIEQETQFIAMSSDIPVAAVDQAMRTVGSQNTGSNDMLPANVRAGDFVVKENRAEDPKFGFKSFGEYARAVHAAQSPASRGAVDERLLIGNQAAAPGVYGSESAGADGGFLIPPEFSTEIFQLSLEGQALLPYTDNTEIDGNSMVFPKDETTPWGTDGIRAYWQNEASVATATKPKLGTQALRMHKLMGLVPITDELLSDTNALTGYVPKKVGASVRWKTDQSILFGTGAGQPFGCFGSLTNPSGATIVVPKTSGQATQTLTVLNIATMFAHMPAESISNAVWLVNNDVLPALFTLTTSNGFPLYMPVGEGAKASPFGTLLGRPVFVTQHANTFSQQGDVSFVDLGYYRTITKAGGMQTASSMHLYFDADVMAFRVTFRLDGSSKIAAPIQPFNGTNQLSPFIQMGAR